MLIRILLLTILVGESAWAGPATQPGGAACAASASKYPLHYPVSDQTRSVMRTAREQIGMTTQDMQAMGLTYDEARAVLKVIRDWVEPQREALERARDEFIAARAPFMSTQGKIYSLEQRLARLDAIPSADADLKSRLKADLRRQRDALPGLRTAFEKIDQRYQALFKPLIHGIDGVLSLPERELWAASRQDKSYGLPVTLQFLPAVTPQQVKRVTDGEDWREVFTPEQQAVNATAMQNYVANKDVIFRAEMKFYFGRDLNADAVTPHVQTVAHHPDVPSGHPNASSGDISKCPFHALFGKKSTVPTTRPKDSCP